MNFSDTLNRLFSSTGINKEKSLALNIVPIKNVNLLQPFYEHITKPSNYNVKGEAIASGTAFCNSELPTRTAHKLEVQRVRLNMAVVDSHTVYLDSINDTLDEVIAKKIDRDFINRLLSISSNGDNFKLSFYDKLIAKLYSIFTTKENKAAKRIDFKTNLESEFSKIYRSFLNKDLSTKGVTALIDSKNSDLIYSITSKANFKADFTFKSLGALGNVHIKIVPNGLIEHDTVIFLANCDTDYFMYINDLNKSKFNCTRVASPRYMGYKEVLEKTVSYTLIESEPEHIPVEIARYKQELPIETFFKKLWKKVF